MDHVTDAPLGVSRTLGPGDPSVSPRHAEGVRLISAAPPGVFAADRGLVVCSSQRLVGQHLVVLI